MSKDNLKQYILKSLQCHSLDSVVSKLKAMAVFKYGCMYSEYRLLNGIELRYNENVKCWSKVIVDLSVLGLSETMSLRDCDIRSNNFLLKDRFIFKS